MTRNFDWTLIVPAILVAVLLVIGHVGSWWTRRKHRGGDSAADADMAKRYGPEWRQLAWTGQIPRALVPDFEAVRARPIDDLSPAQQADARELWIRENKEFFGSYYGGHMEFLLRRLDQARAAAARGGTR